MRSKILLFLLSFLMFPIWLNAASEGQVDMVSVYENKFGFLSSSDYSFLLSKEDSILASNDYLDDRRGYYLTKMMLSSAYAFYGNNRVAFIIIDDDIFDKAEATNDDFGKAIALFSAARIYNHLGRKEDAYESFRESLFLLSRTKKDVIKDIVEFYALYSSQHDTLYNVELGDYVSDIEGSDFASMPLYKSVAMRLMLVKSLTDAGKYDDAGIYVGELLSLRDSMSGGLARNVDLAVAGYEESTGDYKSALAVYEGVLENYKKERLPYNSNYFFFSRKIADLHYLLGDVTEAVKEYDGIFKSSKQLREEHYTFEMDEIVTRLRADARQMENERSRAKSIRLHIYESLLLLAIFMFFITTSIRNIRRLRKSEHEMEKAKSYAEESIKRKATYLSNMSHEIRTPLNSIIGFSSLLTSDDEELDEQMKGHALDVITSNTKMMLQLINDIPSEEDRKAERKHTYQKIDACSLCRNVVETIIKSYNPNLKITFESKYEALDIDTDVTSFSQIMINLLVNAIKFTKAGSVTVSLETKDADTALFSVTDTGCGVPIGKQKKIFERFEKSNESDQGTGLGLSICTLLIKELGGEIWVDPEYTSGARFYFTHPINKTI